MKIITKYTFLILLSSLLLFGRSEMLLNIKASNTSKLSLEFGVQGGRHSVLNFVSLEPGTAGQKVHFGFGEIKGAVGAVWGHRLTVTYLHMNQDNQGYQANRNYVGIEGLGMVMLGIINVGILFDVTSGDPRFSFGVGIGL